MTNNNNTLNMHTNDVDNNDVVNSNNHQQDDNYDIGTHQSDVSNVAKIINETTYNDKDRNRNRNSCSDSQINSDSDNDNDNDSSKSNDNTITMTDKPNAQNLQITQQDNDSKHRCKKRNKYNNNDNDNNINTTGNTGEMTRTKNHYTSCSNSSSNSNRSSSSTATSSGNSNECERQTEDDMHSKNDTTATNCTDLAKDLNVEATATTNINNVLPTVNATDPTTTKSKNIKNNNTKTNINTIRNQSHCSSSSTSSKNSSNSLSTQKNTNTNTNNANTHCDIVKNVNNTNKPKTTSSSACSNSKSAFINSDRNSNNCNEKQNVQQVNENKIDYAKHSNNKILFSTLNTKTNELNSKPSAVATATQPTQLSLFYNTDNKCNTDERHETARTEHTTAQSCAAQHLNMSYAFNDCVDEDSRTLLQKLSINNPFYRFRKQSTSLKEMRRPRMKRKRIRKIRSDTDILNYQLTVDSDVKLLASMPDASVVVVVDSKSIVSKLKSVSSLEMATSVHTQSNVSGQVFKPTNYPAEPNDSNDHSTVITNPFSIFHDDDVLSLNINSRLRTTSNATQRTIKKHRSERSIRRFFDLEEQKRQYMQEHHYLYGVPVCRFERQDYYNNSDTPKESKTGRKAKAVLKHLSLRKLHKSSTSTLLTKDTNNALPQLKKLKITYPNRTQSIHSIRACDAANNYQSTIAVTQKHTYFERLQAKTKQGIQRIKDKCRNFKQSAHDSGFSTLTKDDSFRFISDRMHINHYESRCAAAHAQVNSNVGKHATIYKSYKSEIDLSKNLHYLDAYLEENFDQHLCETKRSAHSVGRVSGTRLAKHRELLQRELQAEQQANNNVLQYSPKLTKSPRTKAHKRSHSAFKAACEQKQQVANYENLGTLPIAQERLARKLQSDSMSSSDYASVFSGPTTNAAVSALHTGSIDTSANDALDAEDTTKLRYEHPKISEYFFENLTHYPLQLNDSADILLDDAAKEANIYFGNDDSESNDDYTHSSSNVDEGIRILVNAAEDVDYQQEFMSAPASNWYEHHTDESNFLAYNDNLAESNFYRSLNQHLQRQQQRQHFDAAHSYLDGDGKDLKYESYLAHFHRHKKKSNSIEYDNEHDYGDRFDLRQTRIVDASNSTQINATAAKNLRSSRDALSSYYEYGGFYGFGRNSLTTEEAANVIGGITVDGNVDNFKLLATSPATRSITPASPSKLTAATTIQPSNGALLAANSMVKTKEDVLVQQQQQHQQAERYHQPNQQQQRQKYMSTTATAMHNTAIPTTPFGNLISPQPFSNSTVTATTIAAANADSITGNKGSRYIFVDNEDDNGTIATTLSPSNIYASKVKNVSAMLTISEPSATPTIAAALMTTPTLSPTAITSATANIALSSSLKTTSYLPQQESYVFAHDKHSKSAGVVATTTATIATTNNRYTMENLRKHYQQQQQTTANSINSSSLSTSSSSTSSMSQTNQQQQTKLHLSNTATAQYKYKQLKHNQQQQQQQQHVRRNSTASNASSSDNFDTFIALRSAQTITHNDSVATMLSSATTNVAASTAPTSLHADYKMSNKRVAYQTQKQSKQQQQQKTPAYYQQQQQQQPQQRQQNYLSATSGTTKISTTAATTPPAPHLTVLNYYGSGAAAENLSVHTYASSNASTTSSSASSAAANTKYSSLTAYATNTSNANTLSTILAQVNSVKSSTPMQPQSSLMIASSVSNEIPAATPTYISERGETYILEYEC